jgi:hypothetical protein
VALFDRKEPTGRWWVDHSLSIALVVLIVVQFIPSVLLGYQRWQAEEVPIDFWLWFFFDFGQGVLDETIGILLIVLLSKWFYERGSAESKGE